ncbi:hypothetical protein GIB67_024367 [Kingdonia uniflora]|uniref:Uncharacterized protein n=1 Tax=Kingdonia uniflora TaxID=39325 RepID=A0A7J7LF77_9MAGN|nr:hypothetical protein GIB67_024367 [Kingdonia uniflora]
MAPRPNHRLIIISGFLGRASPWVAHAPKLVTLHQGLYLKLPMHPSWFAYMGHTWACDPPTLTHITIS